LSSWPLRWPTGPVEVALAAASTVIGVCAALVLGAVVFNVAESHKAGPVAQRQRSPVATATMLLFVAVLYLIVRLRVGAAPVQSPAVALLLAYSGALMFVVGCIVNLKGRVRLGQNWADHVTIYRAQTLVTGGVFGFVRHPLYASLIWMFYGASLSYRNWAAALATTLIFVPMMHYRARQEESMLEQRFPGYARYRSRVGRFFPRSLKRYTDDSH